MSSNVVFCCILGVIAAASPLLAAVLCLLLFVFNPKKNLKNEELQEKRKEAARIAEENFLHELNNITNSLAQQSLEFTVSDFPTKVMTNTMKTLVQSCQSERIECLKRICDKALSLQQHYEAPLEDSITSNSSDPNQKPVVQLLKSLDADQRFNETSSVGYVVDTVASIENITGHNLLTGKSTKLMKLNISSEELSQTNLLMKNSFEVEQSLKRDLAQFYGIDESQIRIRYMMHGSVKVLFSLPVDFGNSNNQKSNPKSLPTFAKILADHKLSPNFQVNTKQKFPDAKKAVEL